VELLAFGQAVGAGAALAVYHLAQGFEPLLRGDVQVAFEQLGVNLAGAQLLADQQRPYSAGAAVADVGLGEAFVALQVVGAQLVEHGLDQLGIDLEAAAQLVDEFGPGVLAARQQIHGGAAQLHRQGLHGLGLGIHENPSVELADCVGFLGVAGGQQRAAQQLGADLLFDLDGQLGVLFQVDGDVLLALTDLFAVVGVPGTGLVDEVALDAQVDDFAHAVDALAVHDLELGLAERWRHLVLDDLDAGLAADHLVAFLDGADAADVQAHGGVELERVTAGGGFGRAEHDADLHADLVDEDHQGVGILDVARHFAQCLGHQAGLQAHVAVAHVAFDLGLGRERGNGVDDHDVDGAGAHDHVADLQGLFASIGLADQQVLDIHAEVAGVDGVKGVLG